MPTDPARSIPRAPDALSQTELPMAAGTAVLGTPQTVGRRTAPNRIVYQAMEGCDGTPEGAPGELTRRRYARFAAGAHDEVAGVAYGVEGHDVAVDADQLGRQMVYRRSGVVQHRNRSAEDE